MEDGMKMPFGVAVVGCGTVGNAAAKLLLSQSDILREKTGLQISLRALVDIDFDRARAAGLDEGLFSENLTTVLADEGIHLIIETIGGLTIARTIIEKALKASKHVVSANKALLANYGVELFKLARKKEVSIGFEASCGGGIPIVRALADGLLANSNEAIYGILNGTANFILTEMTQNAKTYADALKQAQTYGIAEADPKLDVSGMDSAHKLTLLASLAFGAKISLSEIPVKGIDALDSFDVSAGLELGYVPKLLAIACQTDKGLELAVRPAFLAETHPLARVSGVFNAISVYGSDVGHTMYYGRGAGGEATASAVVSDVISIALGTWQLLFSNLSIWPDRGRNIQIADFRESTHRQYLRFFIEDKSGVVAEITAALASRGIGIKVIVLREDRPTSNLVPIVITTHEARERDISEAFESIITMSSVDKDAARIPIIDEQIESVRR